MYYKWRDSSLPIELKTTEFINEVNSFILQCRTQNAFNFINKKSKKKVLKIEMNNKDLEKIRVVYDDNGKSVMAIKNITRNLYFVEFDLWDDMPEETEINLKLQRAGFVPLRVGGYSELD
jgi:hypothetical protein